MSITQTISSFPTAPTRSDPSTFSARADAFMGSLEDMPAEVNTWAGEANTLKTEMNADATTATDAKNIAIIAQDMAVSSANFKGNWSDLTGALNIPASVLHNGTYWMLVSNLADVTASEPSDINTDWEALSLTELSLKKSFML